jgi:peroxidase
MSCAGTTRPSLPDAEPSDIPFVVGCPDDPPVPCFITNGDARGNENVGLVVLHTIWLREHNRIASYISNNNAGLSDEEVFQITRNIVIGVVQKIVYKDFLPILIGDSFTTLVPGYTGYNNNTDPRIPNAFAAAAYRFGHSQIQPVLDRLDENYETIPAGPLRLVDAFLETSAYRNDGGTDPLIRGFLTKPSRRVDEFLNRVITNDLFAGPFGPGLDLASLNIQRSRDHGLPPYIVWKQWATRHCGVSSRFQRAITHVRFLETYGSVDTVDLFIGGLAEDPLPGGIVGAVFSCIFANTFTALRDGDRFYYENQDPESRLFTPEQIAEIEKASLSRVICDNTGVTDIQENAFLIDTRVPCDQLPSMDLSLWTGAAISAHRNTKLKNNEELASELQKLLNKMQQ